MSHCVDRHDMRVVQAGSRLGFILKARDLSAIQHSSKRQDLQSDAAGKRLLLGFVDDTHTATTYLAHQAVIAQLTFRWCQEIDTRAIG